MNGYSQCQEVRKVSANGYQNNLPVFIYTDYFTWYAAK